jgi:hypothetical protein
MNSIMMSDSIFLYVVKISDFQIHAELEGYITCQSGDGSFWTTHAPPVLPPSSFLFRFWDTSTLKGNAGVMASLSLMHTIKFPQVFQLMNSRGIWSSNLCTGHLLAYFHAKYQALRISLISEDVWSALLFHYSGKESLREPGQCFMKELCVKFPEPTIPWAVLEKPYAVQDLHF